MYTPRVHKQGRLSRYASILGRLERVEELIASFFKEFFKAYLIYE